MFSKIPRYKTKSDEKTKCKSVSETCSSQQLVSISEKREMKLGRRRRKAGEHRALFKLCALNPPSLPRIAENDE
jgi:hypothetical protein